MKMDIANAMCLSFKGSHKDMIAHPGYQYRKIYTITNIFADATSSEVPSYEPVPHPSAPSISII